jgi:hypothetical protein
MSAARPRRRTGAAAHGKAAQRTRKRDKATTHALRTAVANARRRNPSWHEGRYRQRRRGSERRLPPWLEGWAIHRGAGKLVLTLVSMGRSAGIGEERQSVLVGVEGGDDAVQRKQRKAAPGDDPVQPPFTSGSGFATTTTPRADSPASCSSSPSSLTPLASYWGGETQLAMVGLGRLRRFL